MKVVDFDKTKKDDIDVMAYRAGRALAKRVVATEDAITSFIANQLLDLEEATSFRAKTIEVNYSQQEDGFHLDVNIEPDFSALENG